MLHFALSLRETTYGSDVRGYGSALSEVVPMLLQRCDRVGAVKAACAFDREHLAFKLEKSEWSDRHELNSSGWSKWGRI